MQGKLHITRRKVLKAGLGAAVVAASASKAASIEGTVRAATAASASVARDVAGRAGKPNILLLMCDQFRGDCLGADGNKAIRTPNFDRIAREGALFKHAYSSLPSCTPARATLLTGLGAWRHGMLGYGAVATEYPNEMPRMLREAGYYTQGIGKMHWHPQRALHGFHKVLLDESGRAEDKGFVSDYRQWFKTQAPDLNPDATGVGWNDYRSKPYALPERLHPTVWTGDRAVEFLSKYGDGTEGEKPGEPFFLKVSFARPHSPYDPPQRFFDMYADADLPKAVIGGWAKRNEMHGQKLSSSTPRGDLGADQVRSSRQGYYGSVTFLDEQIGRILAVLEKRGMLDNTLILYTADHGDMLGDHHLWRKTYAYESSSRVPMLIRWPKGATDAKRGQVLDQPVELRDVLPTLLDAAGVKFEQSRFDGRSMMELIRGGTDNWRKFIDLEHSTCYWPENQWCALTDGHVKYIYGAADGSEQLFDMDADPGETCDLAGQAKHAQTLAEWRGRMVEHLKERGPKWVSDGKLMLRPKPMLYGPNYPKA
jgi:arylsulfatase A-like enzyme